MTNNLIGAYLVSVLRFTYEESAQVQEKTVRFGGDIPQPKGILEVVDW
jgi:hypothetical protein